MTTHINESLLTDDMAPKESTVAARAKEEILVAATDPPLDTDNEASTASRQAPLDKEDSNAEGNDEEPETPTKTKSRANEGNTVTGAPPDIDNDEVAHEYKQSNGGNDDDEPSSTEDVRACRYKDFNHVKPVQKPPPQGPAKEPTFPMKLHSILSNPEFSHIISWLPHGRSWKVLDQNRFEREVIPLFFGHGRYSSFARQVVGWGFTRMPQSTGDDCGSYYHERFLRGMPWLVDTMRRLKASDVGMRKKTEELRPPDLHASSRAHPLPLSSPFPPQIPRINGPGLSEAMLAHQRIVASRGGRPYASDHPGLMGPAIANSAVLLNPYLSLQGRQILARGAVPGWGLSQHQHYPLLNPLSDPCREARSRQLWAHDDGPPALGFGMLPDQQPSSHSWYPTHLPSPGRAGVYSADQEEHLQYTRRRL